MHMNTSRLSLNSLPIRMAGTSGKAVPMAHEAVHVTVTPGLFVTNLTSLPLQLHFHGVLAGQQPLPCHSGSHVSLLQAFGARPGLAAGVPEASSTPASAAFGELSVHQNSSATSPLNAGDAVYGVSVTVAGGQCGVTSRGNGRSAFVIPLLRSTGRERLEIIGDNCSSSVLLTYRVLSAHGRQHLVLFQVDHHNLMF